MLLLMMDRLLLWSICYVIFVDVTQSTVFTDKWAVHFTGGESAVKALARKHGFIYLEKIMPDYYHLQHRKVAKRSISPSHYHHRNIKKEKHVHWIQQLVVKRRVKRDLNAIPSHTNLVAIPPANDPHWSRQWYLNRAGGLNMNVQKAWELGYTGKNVVVSILDDGLESNHPDLVRNYDARASYDVNDRDSDPTPRYDYKDENRHGTRCAGEIAAVANNSVCIVGVAYDAFIGGVRMLDGDVTDAVEAISLSLNPQHIDIYSASWGPDDDGRTVDGPSRMARKAFIDGIKQGRGGLGSVFVWASGNGGRQEDNCNCDGYTNSIYTLSISSATEKGNVPWYSEACSSTLATTYSSGNKDERQIATTDLRQRCTYNHTGTSASAPLAAGIVALALEANPRLTWRDLQHIVVRTANPANLYATDWKVNGVGRKVSHAFGYGLMDAEKMVKVAANWTSVPNQHRCEVPALSIKKTIPGHGAAKFTIDTNGCEGMHNHVKYLEHVMAKVTLTAGRRGDTEIFLISPMGTRSTLLARRPRDVSRGGFNEWEFMTVHNWGEEAYGTWTLEINNLGAHDSKLVDWSLIMMGTSKRPVATPRRHSKHGWQSSSHAFSVRQQNNEKPLSRPRSRTTQTRVNPQNVDMWAVTKQSPKTIPTIPYSRKKTKLAKPTPRFHFTTPIPDFVRDYRPQQNDHTPKHSYHTLPTEPSIGRSVIKNCSDIFYDFDPSRHYIIGWRNATRDDLGIPAHQKASDLHSWTLIMYGTSPKGYQSSKLGYQEGTCLMYNSATLCRLSVVPLIALSLIMASVSLCSVER